MSERKPPFTEHQFEQVIGNFLRAGVIVSALIVLIGGSVFLYRHGWETPEHHVFRGEPRAWSTLSGIFSGNTLKHGQPIIMLGLLALILTPIARVALSLVAFALERDWMYVCFTAIVFGLLLYSLLVA
jgi:uncharacterized membrane protein